jgi:photosystem II stability/assembly factor-like uncharacterized protein
MKSTLRITTLLLAICFAFTNCKKKKEDPAKQEPNPLATVTTKDATNIGNVTATGGGEVTSEGTAALTEQGICWSTNQNPTTLDSKTVLGSTGVAAFTATMGNLQANTTYYVRAYATNYNGTAYGEQKSFKTASQWASVTPSAFLSFLYSNGTELFSIDGTAQKLVRSTNASNWAPFQTGLGAIQYGSYLINGSEMYLCCYSNSVTNLLKSTDSGGNWTPISWPSGSLSPGLFAKSGSNLIVYVQFSGIYTSSNDGAAWTKIKTGNYNRAYQGTSAVFIWKSDSCFRSTDDGNTWNCINSGFPLGTSFQSMISMTTVNGKIFASDGAFGLLVSGDNGTTWTQSNTGLGSNPIVHLVAGSGSNMVVSTQTGPYLSRDGGNSWNTINFGLSQTITGQLLIHNNYIYAKYQAGYSSLVSYQL